MNTMSDSFEVGAVARSADSRISLRYFLGLTPQALCYRPLRGLILPTWYVSCPRPSDFEDLDQQKSRNEAADVRCVSDAALLCTRADHAEAADQLEHKPKSDRDEGGHPDRKQ